MPMDLKKLITIPFLLGVLLALVACNSVPSESPTPTTSSPSLTTNTVKTSTSLTTETVKTRAPLETYNEVKSFLDSANEAYATSQSRNLTPNMTNISVSDFLSLNVVSDSVIEMSGKQYEYQIFSDQSLVNFKNYNVTSTLGIVIPGLGGAEYTVKFSKDDSIIEEFKVPIYQRPWITYSVIAFTHPVEQLLFLSLNYNTGRLNSANIPEIASMWLILCPMQ